MNETDLFAAWVALSSGEQVAGEIKLATLAVETPSGPALAGRDSRGRLHLLVPLPSGTPGRTDRASRGVRIERNELVVDGHRGPYIDVVCHEPALSDLFQKLAAEMLGRIEAEPTEALTICHEVLSRWRELLDRRRPPLGPEAMAGLFGELVGLRKVVERDPARRVGVWTGPTGAKHDLSAPGVAIEVKATRRREGRFVEIHGVEQLQASGTDELFLLFLRVEKASAGETVAALIQSIKSLGVDSAHLDKLVKETGYLPTDEEDPLVVVEERLYAVDETFPKVVPTAFVGGIVPPGVLRIRYEVDLTGAQPMPLHEPAADEVFALLAGAP